MTRVGPPATRPPLPPAPAESAATLSPIIQFSLRLLQSAATCSPRCSLRPHPPSTTPTARLSPSSSHIRHSESESRPTWGAALRPTLPLRDGSGGAVARNAKRRRLRATLVGCHFGGRGGKKNPTKTTKNTVQFFFFPSTYLHVGRGGGNNCCPLNVTMVVISGLSEPSNLFLHSTRVISVKIRSRGPFRRVNDTLRIPLGGGGRGMQRGHRVFAPHGLQRL